MFSRIASAALPALRLLDPERAHAIAIWALARGLVPSSANADHPALAVTLLGRRFANPIGLAAGFDKNAAAGPALLRLGFGFVETGSVTPRPQVWKSPSAHFPADGGPRHHQSAGFQQPWPRGLPAEPGPVVGSNHSAGCECRHQQGRRRSGSRLSRADRGGPAAGRLRRDQCVLAEHARLARPAIRGAAALDPAGRRCGRAPAA